jgi:hypothetical protein
MRPLTPDPARTAVVIMVLPNLEMPLPVAPQSCTPLPILRISDCDGRWSPTAHLVASSVLNVVRR